MVLTSPCSDSAYVEWRELLTACEDYARLTGWRFVGDDFMRLDQRHENDDLRAAREAAMPTALEYADRVRACADAANIFIITFVLDIDCCLLQIK